MSQVEFYFDIWSPHSYLAATQLDATTALWKPYNHLEVVKQAENPGALGVPKKLNYLITDIGRAVGRLGIDFGMPEYFPFDSTGLQAGLALTGEKQGNEACAKASHALFAAVWGGKGVDVRDMDVVKGLISDAGLDGAAFVAACSSQEGKDALEKNTAAAAERGAFGSPTMYVGDDMYWGYDRLDAALAAAK